MKLEFRYPIDGDFIRKFYYPTCIQCGIFLDPDASHSAQAPLQCTHSHEGVGEDHGVISRDHTWPIFSLGKIE